MESRARILGHPVHPMLIVFPLGLLGTSVVFDIIHLATGNPRWADISFWMIAAGIVGGLLSAVFGLVDWLAIPSGTRAKGIGLWHGALNVVVVAMFALAWVLRRDAPAAPTMGELALSFAGLALALVGGWLGGELVDRLGVGVDDGAHLNAPNSLSGRPAADTATGTLLGTNAPAPLARETPGRAAGTRDDATRSERARSFPPAATEAPERDDRV
jgi:uncharacterized membrane protein